MERGKRNKIFKFSGAIIFLLFADQISKYIVRHPPAGGGGFYICNPDLAFGLPIPPALFWIFWTAIIIFIAWSLWKITAGENAKKNLEYWGLVLILAGALANIIDRLMTGCVVDFINLRIWPIFNLADVFISAGAVLWLAKFRKML